ncbi:phytoene desaturase family protein [Alkaliphilus peptidifermentans]|uniref:Phytoene dehydrogenase-related protein n=1 Tax=Alkaliphilus peptidifermentans DSM 18978 TaxID=1120976 RepID=A0A1G5L479_9FIRM|nr:NAD(P)/FAD-dependent oxidoreductase [Alkaliphilus peptidifermentans]SCZ07692.1 Phytoene dehydrogenase-related protein [Alkaliphilus peptidifermentans DSM 18978]
MKKVIVVGAGIAGMSAGIYALQSGFDVTILEQHTIPGGNCTSWRRKGYLFEGALHWLTGSSKKTHLNHVWRNVGALNDNTKIHLKDSLYTCYYHGQEVCFYRDPDKLRHHLLAVSPEDAKEIKSLYKDIKRFMNFKVPVIDIKGVKVNQKSKMSPLELMKMIRILPKIIAFNKISVEDYSQKFKHPAIRELLLNIVGETLTASALFFTLGCLAAGDGGYVEGGSLVMTENMAKRFKGLGGEIMYSSPVEKVIVVKDEVVGVLVNGKEIISDAVIVTADTLTSTQKLFETPLKEPWMEEMRKNVKFMANTFVSIGVECDLSDLPEGMIFPLQKPFTFAGEDFRTLSLHNYASYKGYAPIGCSALTTIFMGDTYEYWKAKRNSGEYELEKEKLAKSVVHLLEDKLPQTKGKVKVIDIATPLTYERYCGTMHGSWMTLMEKEDKMVTYPSISQYIKNLYFAGQRLQTPGGLPVAVDTGRKAVQHLCKDAQVVFQGKVD